MFTLTNNQFSRYARSQAAMVISAHLEALEEVIGSDPDSRIHGKITGILWTCDLLGIDVDDHVYPDDEPA